MADLAAAAEWTGYAVWFAAGWAVLNRTVIILVRISDERRRYRNAQHHFAGWKPPPPPKD